jgi:hypothetical protein
MVGAARQLHTQQIHYLRKRVNYNDKGISGGVYMGTVPAGAMVVLNNVRVTTAFNGTSPGLNVGITPTGNDILTDTGAVGVRNPGPNNIVFPVDTDLFVSSIATGAPTTGQADIVVAYVPNNDL